MAQAFLVQKSGGGINQTLPSQITAFVATADTTPSITLSWTNPTDYFGGVLIVKKIGSAPTGVSDGEKIYSGTAETFTDADVQFDTEYFYRAFAYNAKKQYQTLYAVASAMPVEGIALSEMAEGSLINIIKDGAGANFYLAKHDYESELNGAGRQLMVQNYSDARVTFKMASPITYADNALDEWCLKEYMPKFSAVVQKMMGTTTFYYTPNATSTTVSTLSRPVFHPSLTEYGLSHSSVNVEGLELPIASQLREKTYVEDMASWPLYVYTRSIANYKSAALVSDEGKFATGTDAYWPRPCFTLPATALVNPTPNPDGSYTLIEEVA